MGNCTGKQKKLYPGSKTYIMYHGTTMKNALKIYDKGFRQSSGGMLGCGVYVSRSKEKASHYPVYDKGEPLAILKVEVQVGKVKRIDYQGHPLQKTWNLHGYDTAWVPPNCGMVHSGLEEDCVYDPSRIKANQCLNPPHGGGGLALIKALQLVTQAIPLCCRPLHRHRTCNSPGLRHEGNEKGCVRPATTDG
ncbi:hypothetical protein Q8A67_008807 [Cirrhinus molitorella]|uniref:PARP catalytic domain-containing protein n=1 Tax=Cirrhinus molitorella TaxID=172907 RepID=A0AA88PV65_9TELE|nr:hypothetical protein Q8A67_008807 [Cirrhinus molitorella]